jgi:hypothetical protein
MADEQRALARLPFTREDLQRALDELANRHASRGPSAAPAQPSPEERAAPGDQKTDTGP